MLEVENLTVRYGPFLAVDEVAIRVEAGEIVGLVGANGAGKSSIVKTIGGVVVPLRGRVDFEGQDLAAVPPHRRIRLGISIVPEGRGLFPRMSVEENLLMGGYSLADKAQIARNIERGFALFPILAERRWQAAGTLSGGQQQMLAVAIGLMSDPKLLVLDEPSLGLAPIVIGEIGRALKSLRGQGLTVLLVEQNAKLTCNVSDRIYIVANGAIQHHDVSANILSNREILELLI
ncbi:MAG: ABC transporter ATP-binding protein [Xanthobacteraceae bacterium]|nr:ABC transporter ATP-binding protein [Xanthobacteraceae bacterium]PWB59229.1 MAG: ABC transporter ATP-binding protein [Bradyrhizobiaceae bacterium]